MPAGVEGIRALNVRGPFRGATGYDHHVRAFTRAIAKQGIEIQLVDVPDWSAAKLPPELRDDWFEALDRPVDARVALQFCMPHQTVRHQGKLDVNYTMFEASRVMPYWVRRSSRLGALIVPTESSRQAWLAGGMPDSQIELCPLGVDPELFKPGVAPRALRCRDGRPVDGFRVRFLNVSAVGPRKNLVGLLRAWLRATSRADDAVLVLKLGADLSGPERFSALVTEAERQSGLRLEAAAPICVVFDLLSDAELPGLYAAATHYISLSYGEGWDQAMVEAGASGLALIAPDHSAYQAYLDVSIARLIPSRPVQPRISEHADLAPLFGYGEWWEPDESTAVCAIRAALAGEPMAPAGARDRLSELTWDRAATRLLEILSRAERRYRRGWLRSWLG
jgi:glycosyltransferase involved in cell wall biosynthesis